MSRIRNWLKDKFRQEIIDEYLFDWYYGKMSRYFNILETEDGVYRIEIKFIGGKTHEWKRYGE